ncbi:hypothetical protein OS493_027016 [Desmophyllum pertusum]|uniref:BTB domain-containing protein n=1 Tax=Desmophyllum pertusum TaxID=174260 RepID=A0A9X0CJ95_9CNID|nr:hypothetical protein OS493_027016 [Desmophyllum pertusum]
MEEMPGNEINDEKYRSQLLSKLAGQQRDGALCDVVLLIKDREFPAHKGVLAAANDNIVITREEEVYEAVMQWVKHDAENRQVYFEKLFGKVRLFSMSKEYIRDCIERESLVNSNVACMNLLVRGLNAFVFQDREIPHSGNLRHRKCLEKEVTAIVATGGLSKGKSLKSAMAYSPGQKSWYLLADMNSDRNEHAVVVCGRFLYCIGGYSRGSSVERFDPLTNTWCQVAGLVQRTFAPAAAACDEKIYVFGGKDGFEALTTVQCYQPNNDSWSLGPAMRHARKALCAVEFEGHVYVIGGCVNDNYSLNTVEKLNMGTSEWTEASPMAQERKYACAAVLGDNIVVIGGFQGTSSSALSSCEIYSPREDQWSALADINSPRAAGGVGRVEGKIYIFWRKA